jgi:hypothetical protein
MVCRLEGRFQRVEVSIELMLLFHIVIVGIRDQSVYPRLYPAA